jgi:hypothetical protein
LRFQPSVTPLSRFAMQAWIIIHALSSIGTLSPWCVSSLVSVHYLSVSIKLECTRPYICVMRYVHVWHLTRDLGCCRRVERRTRAQWVFRNCDCNCLLLFKGLIFEYFLRNTAAACADQLILSWLLCGKDLLAPYQTPKLETTIYPLSPCCLSSVFANILNLSRTLSVSSAWSLWRQVVLVMLKSVPIFRLYIAIT